MSTKVGGVAPDKHNYPTPRQTLDAAYCSQILTVQQADFRVGQLTVDALHDKISKLWGHLLPDGAANASSPAYRAWLSYFITNGFGYGTAHAWVRALIRCPGRFLATENSLAFRLVPENFDEHGEIVTGSIGGEPEVDRDGNIILRDNINYVRRVWDVCANRVIPRCWVPQQTVEPVSHAWVHNDDLQYTWSPVNNFLWTLPLPQGSNIAQIREELIAYGVEYSWLDVLCLRQPLPTSMPTVSVPLGVEIQQAREERRVKEWETDVPLIGGVYVTGGRVITYLNGLGRAYHPEVDWEHERSWLRRAWTLQETVGIDRMAIAGMQQGALHPLAPEVTKESQGPNLAYELRRLAHMTTNRLDLIPEMARRFASKPADQVAGLFFVLCADHIKGTISAREARFPKYIESESSEEGWERLVHAITDSDDMGIDCITYQFLTRFPHSSANHWFPSWEQAMRYPDVSLSEEQRPDSIPPRTDLSLRLRRARLYLNCRVRAQCYGSKLSDKYYEYYVLAPENVRGISQFVVHPTKAAVRLEPQELGIHDSEEYVAVTILIADEVEPIVIICRDVSRWRPHQGNKARLYLRKVATFQVNTYYLWMHQDPDIFKRTENLHRIDLVHTLPDGRSVYLE